MRENLRRQNIPNPKAHRRREHEPIPSRVPRHREHAQTAHAHAREQERRHAAEGGVRDGEEDAGELAEDAEEDEEGAAPAAGGAVGAAGDRDDAVVLGEDGEGGDGEEGGEEAAEAVALEGGGLGFVGGRGEGERGVRAHHPEYGYRIPRRRRLVWRPPRRR